MSTEFVDKSGQPPSDQDIDEAIQAVRASFVKHIAKIPPELAVQLPNISRCLAYLKEIKPR